MTTKKSLVSLATGNVVNGIRGIELSAIEPSQSIFFYPGDTILLYRNDFLCEDARFCQYENDKLLPLGDIPGLAVESEGQFAVADQTYAFKVIPFERPNYKAVLALEAIEILKNINPLVLDVRLEEDLVKGKIQGSYFIPLESLKGHLDALNGHQFKDILVTCGTGKRSTAASKFLINAGFNRIFNLRYGLNDWTTSGLELID
jgi:rhodanese-related sulfurtransferase